MIQKYAEADRIRLTLFDLFLREITALVVVNCFQPLRSALVLSCAQWKHHRQVRLANKAWEIHSG